jgi:hypothetical protein
LSLLSRLPCIHPSKQAGLQQHHQRLGLLHQLPLQRRLHLQQICTLECRAITGIAAAAWLLGEEQGGADI